VVALVRLRLLVDVIERIAAPELDEGRLRILHCRSLPGPRHARAAAARGWWDRTGWLVQVEGLATADGAKAA
jgi:hypothetical protein